MTAQKEQPQEQGGRRCRPNVFEAAARPIAIWTCRSGTEAISPHDRDQSTLRRNKDDSGGDQGARKLKVEAICLTRNCRGQPPTVQNDPFSVAAVPRERNLRPLLARVFSTRTT
jgi:hypothetical protein